VAAVKELFAALVLALQALALLALAAAGCQLAASAVAALALPLGLAALASGRDRLLKVSANFSLAALLALAAIAALPARGAGLGCQSALPAAVLLAFLSSLLSNLCEAAGWLEREALEKGYDEGEVRGALASAARSLLAVYAAAAVAGWAAYEAASRHLLPALSLPIALAAFALVYAIVARVVWTSAG
jgi:hypothetical protein